MSKKIRCVSIAIGKWVYKSTIAPETIDEMDFHCPACGSPDYTETVSIIQHGMYDDACVTLFTCGKCFESFHYQYTVEPCLIDDNFQDIPEPPIGG